MFDVDAIHEEEKHDAEDDGAAHDERMGALPAAIGTDPRVRGDLFSAVFAIDEPHFPSLNFFLYRIQGIARAVDGSTAGALFPSAPCQA